MAYVIGTIHFSKHGRQNVAGVFMGFGYTGLIWNFVIVTGNLLQKSSFVIHHHSDFCTQSITRDYNCLQ